METTRPRSVAGSGRRDRPRARVGGSAAVGVLLLASIPDRARAVGALLLFVFSTAVAMTVLSLVFGYTLGRAPTRRALQVAIPALGALSLVFGVVYAYGAVGAAQ